MEAAQDASRERASSTGETSTASTATCTTASDPTLPSTVDEGRLDDVASKDAGQQPLLTPNEDEASTTTARSTTDVPPTTPSWCDLLQTPATGDAFSPAKPMNDKSSLHGSGLQQALERGKMVTRSGQRCGLMMLEMATCYDVFAESVQKTCKANPATLEGGAFQSVTSLSQQTKVLAESVREDIARPLQAFLTSHGETIPAMAQKYEKTRQKAQEARQRAFLARSKYLKALQEAQSARSNVQETILAATKSGESTINTAAQVTPASIAEEDMDNNNKTHENGATPPKNLSDPNGGADAGDNSNSKAWDRQLEQYGKIKGLDAVDRVTDSLSDVKVMKRRYESLVAQENNAVKLAQRMEGMALESLQKLEEQRACLLVDSFVRVLQSTKICLDNLVVSVNLDEADSNNNDTSQTGGKAATTKKNKAGDFFNTFLKAGTFQLEHQAKTGVADAETLGLDEDVGKLRDQVQTSITARAGRIQKVKSLAAFFDEVAAAALKLSNGLEHVVKHQDAYVSSKGTPVEHLRTLLSGCEGPRSLALWSNLMKAVEKEADACKQLARSLKSITSNKLGHFLSVNEKDFGAEKEQDDARWRHLCDAARAETRAEGKYRQSTAQTAKARDRIRSVDNGSGVAAQNPNEKVTSPQKNLNRSMAKAFGNMLSILPDGGEQAMQILTPDARRAVVQRNLQEADEKEFKGKQALDQAVAAKNRAVNLYKEKAQSLVEKYQMEEMSGWEDIKAAYESLVSSVEILRKTRYEPVTDALSKAGPKPVFSALLDIKKWTEKAAADLTGIQSNLDQETAKNAATTSGFMLDVQLEDSESAREVLTLAGAAQSFSFDMESAPASFEENDHSASVNTDVRLTEKQPSSHSLDVGPGGGIADQDPSESSFAGDAQHAARWLQKSFSAPITKTDFKGFRRFNSNLSEKSDNDLIEEGEVLEHSPNGSPSNQPLSANLAQVTRDSAELDCFLTFWPDFGDAASSVGIFASYACAYFPKDYGVGNMGSIEHGRLFVSQQRMFFLAWRGKKAIVQWHGVSGVAKSDNIFGLPDDTLVVSAQKGGTSSSLHLGCFRESDEALQTLEAMAAEAEKTKPAESSASPKSGAVAAKPVAPDSTIKKMETLLSRKLRNVPIKRFYEVVWADENKTSETSFYAQWLKNSSKSYDIDIGPWESPESGATGNWCEEKYDQKRVVKFKFHRKTHLYMGPPIAEVTQIQYCRVEGDDRCVLQMTISFDGIPYSDCFSVEVRWVATRSGAADIMIEVGVHVDFHKSTILKSKIRSGTVQETQPVHESLFTFVQNALRKEGAIEEEGDDFEDEAEQPVEEVAKSPAQGLLKTFQDLLPGGVVDNLMYAVPALVGLLVLKRLFWSSSTSISTNLLLAQGEDIRSLNERLGSMEAEMKLMRKALEETVALLRAAQN